MSDCFVQDDLVHRVVSLPQYECPKHGIVENTLTFDGIHQKVDGRYCIVCIGELLNLLCCRVKEVPRTKQAVASGKTA